ncbi:MAG: carbamoyl transferase [Candidatus Riflebacteria bacterium]|nr:carbamoyl transferase [Candidatus Riflebacteria bacterium]
MIILGINSAYHESSAALVVDGKLSCFIEEERINRYKHGKPAQIDNPHVLPEGAIEGCLKFAGLKAGDIDCFAYSFSQTGRLQNIDVDKHLTPGQWGTHEGEMIFHQNLQRVPDELAKIIGSYRHDRLVWVDHHLAHAASAFYCSPFANALVMVVDGIGEFDSLSVYRGNENRLEKLFSVPYPHSLGFLWEKFCTYLGFSEYDACKLMGLSSYGNPDVFADKFKQIAWLDSENLFKVDNNVIRFRSGDMSGLEALFGPTRHRDQPIGPEHQDLAATLQKFSEDVLLQLCSRMQESFGPFEHLCLAGGGALNCVANAIIQKKAGFKEVYIQPAANDAGSAIGAALQVWCGILDNQRQFVMNHALWGPEYSDEQIEEAIAKTTFAAEKVADPAERAAAMINEGNIVGWFQGRMETGPRALGNRSLLADPRRKDMRDILNRKIKHREDFRPFAPSVLVEAAGEWFEIPQKSLAGGFMLYAYPTRAGKAELIPAVVHVDKTSRIQTVDPEVNPLYHSLISEFAKLSQVPMVLNTSFNDSEPIVMTPADAISTFSRTGIDALFLGNYMIKKG